VDWKVALDILVSLLLIATIGYAVMLNSRLSSLRKNRDDLAKTIVNFNEATVRAESSIPKLRKAAEESGQTLQERVEKAQSLRDDLAFMIERADTMANRLENAVRNARPDGRPDSKPEGRGEGRAATPTSPNGLAPAAPSRVGAGARAAQQAAIAAAAASAEAEEDERSEAERELLRALQSMR
jgi:septal ring-binding cell division protein DamX